MAVSATTVTATVRINERDKTISNVERTAGLVTVTTSAVHGYAVGEKVNVAAVTNVSINGNFVIESLPTTSTFTYRQVAADGTVPANIVTGADTGTTIELRKVVLPNGREYLTSGANQDVALPIVQYRQIDPKWLGAAPALLTDVTA